MVRAPAQHPSGLSSTHSITPKEAKKEGGRGREREQEVKKGGKSKREREDGGGKDPHLDLEYLDWSQSKPWNVAADSYCLYGHCDLWELESLFMDFHQFLYIYFLDSLTNYIWKINIRTKMGDRMLLFFFPLFIRQQTFAPQVRNWETVNYRSTSVVLRVDSKLQSLVTQLL